MTTFKVRVAAAIMAAVVALPAAELLAQRGGGGGGGGGAGRAGRAGR